MNLGKWGIGLAVALNLTGTAIAQDAETPVAAQNGATAQPSACELHVFPTTEGQAQTTSLLSGMGVLGAVADAASHKGKNVSDAEYLRDALGPQMQMEALQSVDLPAELSMPADTQIVYETPIADRKITTKAKTRLSDSSAPCYAELVITQNLYQKKMIYGRSLNNRFIFKDFRDGVQKAKLVKGRGGNGLSHFPPENEDGIEAADADLREAFVKNFLEYSKKI
ncbi:hypothetical protein [Altericroceibacterium endophyticum]|uniref:Uncharacterized protein n=1 Tax=Altericroceibacterium endophyticum TaxID=1808508 RepID=A0A6I4T6R4_9SPHN|nr:hypothetical protein [Altericroceibacterium endophyticum]MXO66517.1 hypothetical protein [Altericroceibacterium endophyticum]